MSAFKECARRAARTFLQAALGYVAANVAGLVTDCGFTKNAAAALLTAACAAGLAALMNLPPRSGENSNANNETKEECVNEQAVQGY